MGTNDMDANTGGSPSAASKTPALIDRVHTLAAEAESLRGQVKEAIVRATETIRQAENQHLSHPTLLQRAYGATIANESAGVHQLHWEHRRLVRDRQHMDELAVEKLWAAYCEMASKSLVFRGEVDPSDKVTLTEIHTCENTIWWLHTEVDDLKKIVSSRHFLKINKTEELLACQKDLGFASSADAYTLDREHVIGAGEGE